ncbi:voltage-gated chloride channel family protein [Carnobacterium gallinarum]|uniref:voltage-gated chloride channel family protein n=1 Tax=Carnobacterium gallinarum TaxID=2749 RepID=UPI000AE57CDF|nr:voltage-gated chloride channel family protein [Carnobacterium gallinarum]
MWIQKIKEADFLKVSTYLIKWLLYGSVVGALTGALSTLFLNSLATVTELRINYTFLLYFLPVAGALISYSYLKFGKNAVRGNNLVIEQANGGTERVPFRLIPLTLIGTLATHLFGGSAGREGTAVQMGGATADFVGRLFKINQKERRILIICGMSAGFSSVFGTPIAGTLFALEVLALGIFREEALFPSLWAALVANWMAIYLGATHTHYSMGNIPTTTVTLVIKLMFAAILFGLTGRLFSRLTDYLKNKWKEWFPNPVLKSFLGGSFIIVLVLLLGTRDYLGLSLPLLQQAFSGDSAPYAFILKLLFTSVTLSTGFQGGEVTPLFVMGATLGSTLAPILGISIPFLAGLGFIGVFAGATNTPIACFIMGLELFGTDALPYLFLICVISYLFSGNSGIYESQLIHIKKATLFEMNE